MVRTLSRDLLSNGSVLSSLYTQNNLKIVLAIWCKCDRILVRIKEKYKMKKDNNDIKVGDMVLVDREYAKTCDLYWLAEQSYTPAEVTEVDSTFITFKGTTKNPYNDFDWSVPKEYVKLYEPKANWQPKEGERVWIISRIATVRSLYIILNSTLGN